VNITPETEGPDRLRNADVTDSSRIQVDAVRRRAFPAVLLVDAFERATAVHQDDQPDCGRSRRVPSEFDGSPGLTDVD